MIISKSGDGMGIVQKLRWESDSRSASQERPQSLRLQQSCPSFFRFNLTKPQCSFHSPAVEINTFNAKNEAPLTVIGPVLKVYVIL